MQAITASFTTYSGPKTSRRGYIFPELQFVDAYIKNETLLAVSFEMYENVLPAQANSSLPVVLAFSPTMKGLDMLPSVEINLVVGD